MQNSIKKNMRSKKKPSNVLLTGAAVSVGFWATNTPGTESKIDRHALVNRHNVKITAANPRLPLPVGNGEFAFSADVTGLQTFYGNTMSHWGWHSYPLPEGISVEDYKLEYIDTYGRKVGYGIQGQGQEKLYAWLRENPHRINLGKIALRIVKANGTPLVQEDVKDIRQTLDLWSGSVQSGYTVEGRNVTVQTYCAPNRDAVAVRIESALIAEGKLAVSFEFPYGSHLVSGADWEHPEAHASFMSTHCRNAVDFHRVMDASKYTVHLEWIGGGTVVEERPHCFVLHPKTATGSTLEFVCEFGLEPTAESLRFDEVRQSSNEHWRKFWSTGGAIDLSGSQDPRWKELQRRIVVSQYLMAVQCAGSLPPQESGLVNNSGWNGKFHLEMHWWHGVHFALWNRWPLLEKSLHWYHAILPMARATAEQQGYRGVRWPKMVGPEGRESPSPIGMLLIWQQPHPIYYAELDYRLHPSREVLDKWNETVFESAEFMASFVVWDEKSETYVLGPPVATVAENTNPRQARNPAFELSYWRTGLRLAQRWRERLGLARNEKWDKVLKGLAALPVNDGLYLQQEGLFDTFTTNNWEHPALVGVCGMLPGDGVDLDVMKATVRKVWSVWQWDRCWGWDFPMMAMAAARNGEPEMAVDALLHPSTKNAFAENGFSSGGPYPYFPSNGGLLTAVAMMAAGWDGASDKHAPGFPDDGAWVVKWEGLKKLP